MPREMYTDGAYQRNNPTWHSEDSPWKAKQILQVIERNDIAPRTICDVGCGAGGVLWQLQQSMPGESVFWGYDISPQAIQLCKSRANARLHFKLMDFSQEENAFFDLVLLIDLVEHLEDYWGFLRRIRPKGEYKVFRIPMDLSVLTVLRCSPILEKRKSLGHIHYFTKEIALQVLRDVDYEILDYSYAPVSVGRPPKSIKGHAARSVRRLLFKIHEDLTVRIAGGYS